MKLIKSLLIVAMPGMLLSGCLLKKKQKSKQKPAPVAVVSAAVNIPAEPRNTNQPKSFNEVVTAGFKTELGFFNVHRQEDKYMLEIPDSLLGRDILLVTRIAKAAGNQRMGYSGEEFGNHVIRFTQAPKNKVFMEKANYSERSSDSTANGMYRNVQLSALQPVIQSFDIKAKGPTQKSSVIDISDFIATDQTLLGFKSMVLQKDKSYVIGMKAYPGHLELQTRNTYVSANNMVTYELNNSFVLLPKNPMKARYADKRIGFFEEAFSDFDLPQGAAKRSIISRYRLEPKPEDVARYLKGELVEPKKPIVFYIDPTTPAKWVKYFIQGVNAWQKAFEKAGFKNAIYALEAPTDNKEWSLYSSKHNGILYMAHIGANAIGKRIHDPRSGEILEAHIEWYHNIIVQLQDWYFAQAAANDPRGRKMEYDDELMGSLIQMVCTHEVGHSIGLRHNFFASSTVPVDSLRSKNYLEKYGHTPSIMDYVRLNYVVQPQDNIPAHLLFPKVGIYDEWAIEWGYRWYPDEQFAAQKSTVLDQWVTDKLNKNKNLTYIGDYGFDPTDARAQQEDVGDDAMRASAFGLANLKVVMHNLMSWTKTPGGDYSNLSRMYNVLLNQYSIYMGHVSNNLRLPTTTARAEDDLGDVWGYVPKSKKLDAIAFLNKQLFATPIWLVNPEIFKRTGINVMKEIGKFQERVLTKLIAPVTYHHMINSNLAAPPHERYGFGQMLIDLNKGIFTELSSLRPITADRRYLQRMYVEKLIEIKNAKEWVNHDMSSMAGQHSRDLIKSINNALRSYKDQQSRAHLSALKAKLGAAGQEHDPEAAKP